MAKQTPEEKAAIKLAKQAKIAERHARSAQAMAQGPDTYAKQIIASALQIPFIHFWYSLFYIVFDYIFGGHIIVKNWQKLLVKAGYVSEGALGVAGVWALVNHVAIIHNMLAGNPITKQVIDPMNAFMMAAFTLIPDLILASAILMTIGRYTDCRTKEKRGIAVIWALLYSACTVTFFILTIYTLSTVGSVAGSGDITKVIYASGTELQVRVISSFLYGLFEVIYAYTHKGQVTHQALPNSTPATPQIDIEKVLTEALALSIESKMEEKLKGLQSEIASTLKALSLSIERQNESLLAGIERQLFEKLKGHTDEMKAFHLEEFQPFAESLYRVETGFNESFLPVAESLVQIPAFSEQLSQIETTVTQQVTRLHGALQASTQTSIPAVSATRTVKTETRRITQPSTSNFDRKAFVEACLQEDPDMSIPDMQRRAEALGQSLSTGSASTYRTAFTERQMALKKVNLVTVVEA